jgi:DNA-binding Lrp family transcriptional regulator
MAIGFVLIRAAPNYEREVYYKLCRIKGIAELHPIFGEYDFIVKIEVEDFDKLSNIVVKKIRTILGVVDTKTLTRTKF